MEFVRCNDREGAGLVSCPLSVHCGIDQGERLTESWQSTYRSFGLLPPFSRVPKRYTLNPLSHFTATVTLDNVLSVSSQWSAGGETLNVVSVQFKSKRRSGRAIKQ